MAYRFEIGEPFDDGLRRVAGEQIDQARRMLIDEPDHAKGVHDARKCLKRIRALLRLLRPGLGETVFQAENGCYRAIGRLLAGARDLKVLADTSHKLGDTAALKDLRITLDETRRQFAMAEGVEGTKQAVAALIEAKVRLAGHCIDDDFEIVADGLKRSFRRARSAMAEARRTRSDEDVHEWRKGVQQHWRHMLLLQQAWPDYFVARAEQAKALSQILGDDHDLSMLALFVGDTGRSGMKRTEARKIADQCRQQQAALRKEAELHAARLFSDAPGRLARKVTQYWMAVGGVRPNSKPHGAKSRSAAFRGAPGS